MAAPWPFLRQSGSVLFVSDPARLAAECGCPAGQQLSPALASLAAQSPFVVLRDNLSDPPCDLICECGSVAVNEPPAFTWSKDGPTHFQARKKGFVIAAFGGADLAILRLLQMPVTVATGLASVTAAQGRAFCGRSTR